MVVGGGGVRNAGKTEAQGRGGREGSGKSQIRLPDRAHPGAAGDG